MLSQFKPLRIFLSLLALLPMIAFAELDDTMQLSSTSTCAIYNKIALADEPIVLSDFKSTPNGIDIASRDYLTQVSNFQPCRASAPFNKDEEVTSFFKSFITFLDSYRDKDIANFPQEASLDNKVRDQDFTDRITNGENVADLMSQERLVQIYINMAVASYLGEVVPKDDFKAIQYMSKVADFYQNTNPMRSPLLEDIFIQAIYRKSRLVSINNPIQLQLSGTGLTTSRLYILSQAGHFDTQTKLLEMQMLQLLLEADGQYIAQSGQEYTSIVAKWQSLAEQGSHLAINSLAKHFRALAKTDNRYKLQANYWTQMDDALSKLDMSWQ